VNKNKDRISLKEAFERIQKKAETHQNLHCLITILDQKKKSNEKRTKIFSFACIANYSTEVKIKSDKFAQVFERLQDIQNQMRTFGFSVIKEYCENKRRFYIEKVSEKEDFIVLSLMKPFMRIKREAFIELLNESRRYLRQKLQGNQRSFLIILRLHLLNHLKQYFDALKPNSLTQGGLNKNYRKGIAAKLLMGILQGKLNKNNKDIIEALRVRQVNEYESELKEKEFDGMNYKLLLLFSRLAVLIKQRKTWGFNALKHENKTKVYLQNKRFVALCLRNLLERLKKKVLRDAFNSIFDWSYNVNESQNEIKLPLQRNSGGSGKFNLVDRESTQENAISPYFRGGLDPLYGNTSKNMLNLMY